MIEGRLDGRAGFAMPQPDVVMRVVALQSAGTPSVGLFLERHVERNRLRQSTLRYGLTERQIEVVHLLLLGLSAAEIAARLSLAESSVADHLKRLLFKTRSRNRAEMLAKVLEWSAEPQAAQR